KIPVISIAIDKVDEENIGELIGFFQWLAIYSALLRDVNPFDQPQVENSKKISFEYRKNSAKKIKTFP
ncbi:MAG: glucose-6-phosphate isomerase, partial [Candidatus Diapherotrites archaeon]|nr:glucose-6-phosphate isomerase [Candidatus Diapherotrites archaeon]